MSVTRDDLLAVIDENPADDASWLAYADWLQQKGDPRGELHIGLCSFRSIR